MDDPTPRQTTPMKRPRGCFFGFMICLLVVTALSSLCFFCYCWVSKIPAFIPLYITGICAGYAILTGAGLLRNRLVAWRWALWFPLFTLPLWFIPFSIIAGIIDLVSNGLEGSHTDTYAQYFSFQYQAVKTLIIPWLLINGSIFIALWKTDFRNSFQENKPLYRSRWQRWRSTIVVIALALCFLFLPAGKEGWTLIHTASLNGWTGVVNCLLHCGIPVNIRTWRGYTPLHYAAGAGRRPMVAYLLSRSAAVNARSGDGNTPVLLAAENPYAEKHYVNPYNDPKGVLVLLINHGADLRVTYADGNSVFYYLWFADIKLIHLMVEHGAPVNGKTHWGETPLSSAVAARNTTEIGYLIDMGAIITGDIAITAPNPRVLSYLFDRGLDPNVRSSEGETLLEHAVKNGKANIIPVLVQHGIRVNVRDSSGASLLHPIRRDDDYLSFPSEEVARTLIRYGADVNARDRSGRTPLFFVFPDSLIDNSGFPAYAELLLAHGADTNAQDNHGETPLHKATRKRNIEAARFFLHHGARVNIRDRQGHTPYGIAQSDTGRNNDLCVLLSDYGGQM